jgi:hypothetical protein
MAEPRDLGHQWTTEFSEGKRSSGVFPVNLKYCASGHRSISAPHSMAPCEPSRTASKNWRLFQAANTPRPAKSDKSTIPSTPSSYLIQILKSGSGLTATGFGMAGSRTIPLHDYSFAGVSSWSLQSMGFGSGEPSATTTQAGGTEALRTLSRGSAASTTCLARRLPDSPLLARALARRPRCDPVHRKARPTQPRGCTRKPRGFGALAAQHRAFQPRRPMIALAAVGCKRLLGGVA